MWRWNDWTANNILCYSRQFSLFCNLLRRNGQINLSIDQNVQGQHTIIEIILYLDHMKVNSHKSIKFDTRAFNLTNIFLRLNWNSISVIPLHSHSLTANVRHWEPHRAPAQQSRRRIKYSVQFNSMEKDENNGKHNVSELKANNVNVQMSPDIQLWNSPANRCKCAIDANLPPLCHSFRFQLEHNGVFFLLQIFKRISITEKCSDLIAFKQQWNLKWWHRGRNGDNNACQNHPSI